MRQVLHTHFQKEQKTHGKAQTIPLVGEGRESRMSGDSRKILLGNVKLYSRNFSMSMQKEIFQVEQEQTC